MSEPRNEDLKFSSTLAKYKKEGVDFSGWSERQIRVFLADVENNENTGRLEGLNVNDSCVKAFPSVFGKIDYTPTVVINADKEQIEVGVSGDEMSWGKFQVRNGINIYGPDFGWLTLQDQSGNFSPPKEIGRLPGKRSR